MKTLMAFAFLLVTTLVAQAEPKTAKCVFEHEGVTFLRDYCNFYPSSDGSFEISTFEEIDDVPYLFVQLNMERPGVAVGYWNGGGFISRAHGHLNVLVRSEEDRACWENVTTRVCAW